MSRFRLQRLCLVARLHFRFMRAAYGRRCRNVINHGIVSSSARQFVFKFLSLSTAAVIALSLFGSTQTNPDDSNFTSARITTAREVRDVSDRYGDAALVFEPNQGQTSSNARFVSRAQGLSVVLGDREISLSTRRTYSPGSKASVAVRMTFPGATFLKMPMAFDKQAGISNYLLGNDPTKWRTGIPNYARVGYTGIYPGIDLIFYGNHRRLEHDFVVSPGADYRRIRVRLHGAEQLTVGDDGRLEVGTADGANLFQCPGSLSVSGE